MSGMLLSKYHVRTPEEDALDSGTFVLRPFNKDGTVRDDNAIEALKTYANWCQNKNPTLAIDLKLWLNTPQEHAATSNLNIPSSPKASK